MGLSQSIV